MPLVSDKPKDIPKAGVGSCDQAPLGVICNCQLATRWCWAACYFTIIKFLDPQFTGTEVSVAEAVLRKRPGNEVLHCSPMIGQGCNEFLSSTDELSDGWETLGYTCTPIDGRLGQKSLVKKMKLGRPVEAGVTTDSSDPEPHHVVVIAGLATCDTTPKHLFLVLDPLCDRPGPTFGCTHETWLSYADLCDEERWVWSWYDIQKG